MQARMLRGSVMLLVLALWGCEGTSLYISTMPTTFVAVRATIGPPAVGVGYLNATTVHQVPGCRVVIVAVRTVSLDHMTLRLIDGSSVGGPTITFPQAELTTQFGTLLVTAGTTRSFDFAMPSTWSRASYSMAADIGFMDGGVMSAVTATGTWR